MPTSFLDSDRDQLRGALHFDGLAWLNHRSRCRAPRLETGRRAVARPAILFRALDHLCADRAEDNVSPTSVRYVSFSIRKALNRPPKRCPERSWMRLNQTTYFVFSQCIPRELVALRGLDDEVKVIGHEDERADAPAEARRSVRGIRGTPRGRCRRRRLIGVHCRGR
jgi:hypothetical protein